MLRTEDAFPAVEVSAIQIEPAFFGEILEHFSAERAEIARYDQIKLIYVISCVLQMRQNCIAAGRKICQVAENNLLYREKTFYVNDKT